MEFGPEELVPLFSNEAELAALGAMTLSDRAADEVKGMLHASDFYRPSHRIVFNALCTLRDRGVPIDAVLLRDELKDRKQLADIGGEEYLIHLMEYVPSPANSAYYASIVRDKAVLRRLDAAASQLREIVHGEGDATSKAAKCERLIREAGVISKDASVQRSDDVLKEVMDEFDAYWENPKQASGIKTGFSDLDWKYPGFFPGDLIILGARPAMGKTALGVQIGVHVARGLRNRNQKGSVLIVSQEMKAKQLMRRMLSNQSEYSFLEQRRNVPLTEEQYQRVSNAANAIYGLPLFFEDSGDISPTQLLAKARKIEAEHGLTFIVVDYLQLMGTGQKPGNRTQEIDVIARDLKKAATTLDVPILALSQLSRAVETREDKTPQLSDVRESGSIEANADGVLLLYRPSYYKAKQEDRKEDEMEEAHVIIAKQRNGETGRVTLAFKPKFTTFFGAMKNR